jgi:hypothetical protein
VVCHVPGGWVASRRFQDLFEAQTLAIPGMAELVPHFSLLIEDLAHLSNDELKARALAAFPTLALWALRDARHIDQFLDNLGTWAAALTEAYRAPKGIQSLGQLFRYVALVADLRFEVFRAKLEATSPEIKEITMTMAEQLRREGKLEGRVEGWNEGRNEGRIETLRKLLTIKFRAVGAEHEAQLGSASVDDLDRYLERVLTAETIDGVFAR